jgi:hypothetical protein
MLLLLLLLLLLSSSLHLFVCTLKIKIHSDYMARHDTTRQKTNVHSHIPAVNRQTEYSSLPVQTTLYSPSLSLSVGYRQIEHVNAYKNIYNYARL